MTEKLKLQLGGKYFDLEEQREYELVGVRNDKDGKKAILVRGVATQYVSVEDFWKVFREV